jgi:hypothetical protein
MGFLKHFFGERVTWHDIYVILKDEENRQVKKWITVYFSIYFKKIPNDEKEIEKTIKDIIAIVNNTQSLFDDNGNFLGCINPFLQINTIFSDTGSIHPHLVRKLNKTFKGSIVESPDQYQLIIFPVKENSDEMDLYPLETLCYDMYNLGHASDYITNLYKIKVHSTENSFNPEMVNDVPGYGNNVPFISHFIRLLVYRYPVKERFEFQKVKPTMDTWLFGGGSMTFENQIDMIRRNQPKSEWSQKVNEIIADTKK